MHVQVQMHVQMQVQVQVQVHVQLCKCKCRERWRSRERGRAAEKDGCSRGRRGSRVLVAAAAALLREFFGQLWNNIGALSPSLG